MAPAKDLADGGAEKAMERQPLKRALLIGSSYGGLPGTENDVNTMVRILKRYGFDSTKDITKLCGSDATRHNILTEWNRLTTETIQMGDIVVIYYSGHGGLAEPPQDDSSKNFDKESNRIQFLVPYDFDDKMEHWNGILDSELSLLLLKTTARTANVTYILDCCHSARLGRAPNGSHQPQAKVLKFNYELILDHMKQLRNEKKLLESEFWINPDVVRIAAAGDREAAWQHRNASGQDVGIMTEKLDALMNSPGSQLSWRSVMLGIKALVELEFPNDKDSQQPRSAGADMRIPFSLIRRPSKALIALVGDEYTLIEGGAVHGIEKGDEFTLIPFRSQEDAESIAPTDTESEVPNARVTSLKGFTALIPRINRKNFPTALALALPFSRNRRWPVRFPPQLIYVKDQLDRSNFFKSSDDDEEPIVEFRQEDASKKQISLHGQGIRLASRQVKGRSDIEHLLSVAHIFAQTQNIASFEGGEDDEEFTPQIEIKLGLVQEYDENQLVHYKTGSKAPETIQLTVGDNYYIRIKYNCTNNDDKLYLSVLRVDLSGRVILVTRAWEQGLDLSYALKSRLLAANSHPLKGIPVDWPESVPIQERVGGSFVIVVTREPIDLRSLEAASSLDFFISRGQEISKVAARRTINPYAVIRIPYSLRWHSQSPDNSAAQASDVDLDQNTATMPDLPTPETTEEGKDLYSHLRGATTQAKSGLGQFIRFVKQVPPYVWVINQHTEEITVVVNKFRPNRQLSNIGVGVSIPGGSLDIGTTTFTTGGTEKKLAPQGQDPNRSIAAFPLWTREDGFGIISIYVGPDRKPAILNDQVRIGARVYFRGGPDLILED